MARRGDACCASPCDTLASAQGFLSSYHRGSPAAARHRLKVSSQDGAGANGCGSGRMSVAFSLAWLKPSLELLQIGIDLHCKARGPCASTKVEPANDRPSPRSVLVQTSTRPPAAPGCRASFRRQLATARLLPFKPKEFVPMLSERGTVLVLGRALQAPEVMPDDAVQAHPGRLRLRRPRRTPKVGTPLLARRRSELLGTCSGEVVLVS